MLKFWSKPAAKPLSEKLRHMLVQERGLTTQAGADLRVLEETGRYAGRKVRFFRVFDPATAKAAGRDVTHFSDLDARTTLHYGHTEKEGGIVLSRGEWPEPS